MRILCDEGVDQEIVERLRAEGHDVVYIAEVASGAFAVIEPGRVRIRGTG